MVTGPLPRGTLLVDPADTALLAFLAHAGARSVARQRRLPTEVARLLGALAMAAGEARVAAIASDNGQRTDDGGASSYWSEEKLTTTEAATMLQVTPGRIRQLVGAGELLASRHGRALAVSAASVAALAARRAA